MTIYIGRALNKATLDTPGQDPIFQEVSVEVKAFDDGAARQAIETHCRERETSYENEKGDTVRWTFVKIISLSPTVEEVFTDGVRELSVHYFQDLNAFETVNRGA